MIDGKFSVSTGEFVLFLLIDKSECVVNEQLLVCGTVANYNGKPDEQSRSTGGVFTGFDHGQRWGRQSFPLHQQLTPPIFQNRYGTMSLASCRPRVAEMRFQLLGRTVHPELFQIHKTHRIQRENYSAEFRITSDGHYITWRAGQVVFTEIAASASQLLPHGSRLVERPMNDVWQDQIQSQGCSYDYQCQLERVSTEMFQMIQKQLGESANHHELIQIFNSSGRLPIGGVSFIHVESRLQVLRVHAIHTFPDDCVLVKTQSCFRSAGNKGKSSDGS